MATRSELDDILFTDEINFAFYGINSWRLKYKEMKSIKKLQLCIFVVPIQNKIATNFKETVGIRKSDEKGMDNSRIKMKKDRILN